ncbi:hypothetical protein Lqui_1054 [Legionella quinlivanii]|uniref:DUF3592 domain-containing protein n=1 Tax=Legionella quinlivanii TaxID=45073 RepID=A0A0W0Y6D7_9GAMM|nr:DUF3592 domain-containing protein [Legionella quinlivanii]KTD52210.1 hypothetical protein Lqui_1054 [Legionella quinlivanii]MCW8452474.1 DUF3592 domain-containing protein [Legionella quinlivanii]SEF75609.1 Protein of unknown function [Legionella quinlivanii DSM 21216]STY12291.1 Protein of uncharacterised function (DUF3592) [Legionella quinlivanii]
MTWQGIIAFIWMLILLFMLGYFWRYRSKFKTSQAWPVAKGQITELIWVKKDHFLWADIQYSYVVNGVSYANNSLFIEQRFRSPKSAYARQVAYQAALAYEKGEDIRVFYNPSNPQEAALDTRVPLKLTIILVLLGAFLLFHVSSFIFGNIWWQG